MASSTTTHDCPGPACIVTGLSRETLACPRHWRQVTVPTKRLVYQTWQGDDIGAYLKARAKAISEMRP